jgi:hypothetical protein
MRAPSWLWALAVLAVVTTAVEATAPEIPQEVLERYWECRERHDLDVIRDLLWVHHSVERIDASIYGLPMDDFDDRSLLTIQERLDYRAAKAAMDEEMAVTGPIQYPHFLRQALDAHYLRTGDRPDCSAILAEAGLGESQIEEIGPGWPTDLNLTAGDTASRGEVHVAVDADDPSRIIATAVPSGIGTESSSFAAVTSDWGQTWHLGQVGNNGGTVWECDPASYYQRSTGMAYHAKLACTTGQCTVAQARVRRSTDGVTWIDCESRPGTQSNEDREWIVIDNTPTSPCYGTIYATYHALNSEKVSRSTDNCATWSTPASITGSYQAIGPDLAVAADGSAYVVWDNYGSSSFRIAKTTNCGVNWGPFGGSLLGPTNGGVHDGSIPAQCQRNAKNMPYVDVDRNPASSFFGRVYVAMFTYNQSCSAQANWNCATWDTNWTNPCNFDVFFTYSDDGGTTWAPRVNLTAVDGNNVDHFMGMMRVDQADGAVYIGYHRTRLNPASLADRQTSHYFVMRSIDGGETWEEPLQVSSLESNQRLAGGSTFERGDYNGIDVAEGVVWPIWIDRRSAATEEEIVLRKICSEPAHWSERAPGFTPPSVEVFGDDTLTVRWTAPDVYWGDGGEDPAARRYELWVDGALVQDSIPWTASSASYVPGDAATHSYVVRAVNQCGLVKDYAAVDHAACAANPTAVDVTPDGPLTLCDGSSQLLTATPNGGTGDDYQWYRDEAPVGTSTATYNATDSGTHRYNCEVTNAACTGGVTDLLDTQITWQQDPLFAGLASVSDPGGSECSLDLGWSPAAAVCAGPVAYNVYRSQTAGFEPGPSNLIAAAVSGTSFADLYVLQGATYYYVVRAQDTSNGAEEGNTVELPGVTAGASNVLWEDDLEGGNLGWEFALGSPPATAGGFVIGDPVGTVSNYGTPSQPEDDHTAGGVSCLYSAENPAGNAGVNDIDGGEVVATSPTIDGSGLARVTLSLWRWFFNEDNDDTGDYYVLEVSNDDGSTWTLLEEIPGSITNANHWEQVSFNFEEYVDLTSTLRFRVRAADGTAVGDLVELAIDDVQVTGYQGCVSAAYYVFSDGFESGDTSAWSSTTP